MNQNTPFLRWLDNRRDNYMHEHGTRGYVQQTIILLVMENDSLCVSTKNVIELEVTLDQS